MQELRCPHCGTAVPGDASVCCGCNAEVIHGASRRERAAGGCLLMLIGIPVTFAALGLWLKQHNASTDAGFFVLLGLIVAAAFCSLLGALLARFLLRSKVRFFRSYKHR
jgi:predicted nucleic acid-binding Zn ribbon protein